MLKGFNTLLKILFIIQINKNEIIFESNYIEIKGYVNDNVPRNQIQDIIIKNAAWINEIDYDKYKNEILIKMYKTFKEK